MIKKIRKYIPVLPTTALTFCLVCLFLWRLDLIPKPQEVLLFLEGLYTKYGYIGLFISTFLESVVYLGLYFPGSVIIALAVFLSDGKFITLLNISLLVAFALTATSIINYFLGIFVSRNHQDCKIKHKIISKGLFFSMLHPNLLSFYFFNAGIERQNFKKVFFVPLFMIPYGFLVGFVLSKFSTSIRHGMESPYFILTAVLLWFLISFAFEYKRKKLNRENKVKPASGAPERI